MRQRRCYGHISNEAEINLDDPSIHMVYFLLAPPLNGWAAAHVCKSRQVLS